MAKSKNDGSSDEITNEQILLVLKNAKESLDKEDPNRPHWTEVKKKLLDLFSEKLEQLKDKLK